MSEEDLEARARELEEEKVKLEDEVAETLAEIEFYKDKCAEYEAQLKAWKEPSLTLAERDAYEMVVNSDIGGFGVWPLAENRDISYAAAYKLLENLKKKGFIDDQWEAKGHKKRYFVNDKDK